jgi:tetratricopeptide (TPR) repeat protein
MGDQAKGLELHRYNVDHFPASQFAMMSQGIITKDYLTNRDFTNAESAMETLLSRFAGQEELPREVYKIAKYHYARAGRQDKALELYQYMAATWPENDYALSSLQEEAISRIKRYQMVEAQEVIEIILTSFSKHKKLAQALNGIAKAYHQVQDDEKALEYYNYVLDNYPINDAALEARKGTAIAYIGLAQDEQVDAAVEKLMTEFADHSGLDHAILLIAEEYLRIAMLSDHHGEGAVAEQNYVKSLKLFTEIIQEMPESNYLPHAYYMAGHCHVNLLQYAQGVEYYQKVVDDWPNFGHARSAQTLAGSYIVSMKKGGELTAEEANPRIQAAFENVLANYKNPESYTYRHALQQLGQLHMEEGRWQEAAMYYEIFREDIPNYKYIGSILTVLYDFIFVL